MGLILRVLAVSLSAITLACSENYHSGLKWILDSGGGSRVEKVQMSRARADGWRGHFPLPCRDEPCILKRHEQSVTKVPRMKYI